MFAAAIDRVTRNAEYPHHEIRVILIPSTSAVSAATKGAGNIRPRLAARRRIPAAAFGESEYLSDTPLCRTADNEHATAPLGDSEILAVQHAPSDSRPALP
jgi:hypothetical protein